MFDRAIFDAASPDHAANLAAAYVAARGTRFSRNYDDADLTMLIALGLYANIITPTDELLNPHAHVGFSVPIEWLQYASFLIDNDPKWEYELRQLRTLYTRCADALAGGSPTAFADFRRMQERVLVEAPAHDIVLNRRITAFIRDSAVIGCVPIGFTDRPNASLGLATTLTPACTVEAIPNALINRPLTLTAS